MTGQNFERLVELMATLRGPEGCPWDKEQDFDSLKPMLIEEVYELIEAIDERDYSGLAEELGDILLHILFNAQLGKEAGKFTIDTVIEELSEKLIRRHPHVFGDETASDAEQVVENWEAIKEREKAEKNEHVGKGARSVLDGIPSKLPALHEAHKISSRVVRVGFDWPQIDAVFEKLQEEITELREAIADGSSSEAVADEIGDVLFTMVNVARFQNIDTESALKQTNRKFRSRFQYVEQQLRSRGKTVADASLAEMEELWQQAKLR